METLAYVIGIVMPIIIYIVVMCLSGVISTKGEIKEYIVLVEETVSREVSIEYHPDFNPVQKELRAKLFASMNI